MKPEQLTELRIKVAEAMGWNPHGSFTNCFQQEVRSWLFGGPNEGGMMAYGPKDLPEYETSLDAAKELIEALRKEGWSVLISSLDGDDKWAVSLSKLDIVRTGFSDNLATAICKAFLKVKGQS